VTENQKAFLIEFAALLRKHGISKLNGEHGLPVRMNFENDDGRIQILKYEDGVFEIESRSSFSCAEIRPRL